MKKPKDRREDPRWRQAFLRDLTRFRDLFSLQVEGSLDPRLARRLNIELDRIQRRLERP